MINETYSAFVQGFMPTMARPEVDILDGLTMAITVGQERMGGDARSTVGTATDANAMLRILFSRLGEPHVGSPQAFSFNVASISGAGAVTIEKGGKSVEEKRSFSITGGMCLRCEGRGSVSDFDLTELYDETKSLDDGALVVPGYSMDGWFGRIFRGCGYFPTDKPIAEFTKKQLHDLLHREPTKIEVDGINLTYEGLIPKIQKSMLSKDVDSLQPHIRAFVERVITFTTCPECDGTRLSEAARSSKIAGISIADACAMQISELAAWVADIDEPSVVPLVETLGETVVEHKPETIAIADHVVDLGPGAGAGGGTICFEGDVDGLRASDTVTGHHLDDRASLNDEVRTASGTLEVRGAAANNLQDVDVDVDLPLGVLCVVTGVAGSGKKRFQASVLEYTFGGRNIAEVLAMSVTEATEFFGDGDAKAPGAHKILERLQDVGLGYLKLGQPLPTLSGGERQRLKLATHMGDKGGVYVLDEPTTGLHLADVEHLLSLLDRLVEAGKSVIVIEHHQAVMAHADWIIDLGPGAGHDGGKIVFEGTPAELIAEGSTITAEHLAAYVGQEPPVFSSM